MKECAFYIEGLGPERAIDKLASAGVEILSAEKIQKNTVVIHTDGKEYKKVFAILQNSCYNIKKVRTRGARRALELCRRFAGLLVGGALFCASILFFQSRVLAIEITGSGAYLNEQVNSVLRENGVSFFTPPPQNVNYLTSLVLSLPRVSFCSFTHRGGILTVDVEVNDEDAILQTSPLISPVAGNVERLTVVRGTPLTEVGAAVTAGDVLVADYVVSESGQANVLVIAEAVIVYPVSASYALPEEQALRQAYLDYGEIDNIHITPTDGGTLIEGQARVGVALNLG